MHRPARKEREGMVLLIVLMIITVASATAAYALQGSAVEVQAAGAYKRRMQVRYASESLVMATATLIDEITFCTPGLGGATPSMARYALPDLNLAEPNLAGGVSALDFGTDSTRATPLPSECDLRFPVGTACLTNPAATGGTPRSIYFPFFAGVKERWARADSSAGGGTTPYRCAVTVFGELDIDGRPFLGTAPGDAIIDDGAQDDGTGRRYHDTISMSQAYYDFSM